MFVALNLAGNRYKSILTRLCRRREEMLRQSLERFALLFISFFININIVEIPFPEGFKHALLLRALDELGHCQACQWDLSVMTFRDENDLCSVAGHAGRERFEPTWTGGSAGTGFFKVTGYFPRGLTPSGCRFPRNAQQD